MHSKEVEITCKDGIHMRPASRLVKKAKEFEANIIVICGNLQASAKSLFKLQTLSLEKGVKIIIQADGSDEREAVDALSALIAEIE
jgi:phosphocarrier protein HPr